MPFLQPHEANLSPTRHQRAPTDSSFFWTTVSFFRTNVLVQKKLLSFPFRDLFVHSFCVHPDLIFPSLSCHESIRKSDIAYNPRCAFAQRDLLCTHDHFSSFGSRNHRSLSKYVVSIMHHASCCSRNHRSLLTHRRRQPRPQSPHSPK